MKRYLSIIVFLLSIIALTQSAFAGESQPFFNKPLPAEFDAFYDDLMKYVGSKLDAEIKQAQDIINSTDPNVTQLQKDEAKAKLDYLKGLKKNITDTETVRELYNNTKSAFDSVKGIAEEWEKNGGSLAPTTFLPSEINLSKLNTYRTAALKGYDYYNKITDLSSKLKEMDTLNYSPETARLARSLATLGTIMSEFGEKVPLIGSFIKGYGDITVALVDTVNGLNKKLKEDINQGCIGTGTRGIGDIRNVAWNEQGLKGITACRENGLRDVYVNTDDMSKIYLWDPHSEREVNGVRKKGRWWEVHKVGPGITLAQLNQRYVTYFEKGGIKNPTAKQILHEYEKAVEIKLVADNIGVSPGEKLKVKPIGIRASDGETIDGLYFEIYQLTEYGISEKAECKSGQIVEWQAPASKGRYTLAAELQPASQEVWRQLKPGKLEYYVGNPTYTKLSLKPTEAVIGEFEKVNLIVSVMDSENIYLDKGTLELRTDPELLGFFRPNGIFFGKSIAEGNINLEWTPYSADLKPGRIEFIANYKGYQNDYDDIFICPSRAVRELTVYEKRETVLNIVKSRNEGEKHWKIKASITDASGKPVEGGEIRFSAEKSGFLESPVAGADVQSNLAVGAPEAEVLWIEPDEIENPVRITVIFPEYKGEDCVLYRESKTSFLLPETLQVATKIELRAEKADSEKHWNITARVLDMDGNPVKAGSLELTAEGGMFKENQGRSIAFTDVTRTQKAVWIEPDDPDRKLEIKVSYKGEPFEGTEFQDSSASVFLPENLLEPTEIVLEVSPVDKANLLWEISMSVTGKGGKDIKEGSLKLKTDRGVLAGSFLSLEWDLSAMPNPVIQWQGKQDDPPAKITLNYGGDGKGENGENLRFKPSSKDLTLPPERDADPPVISITGVRDDGVFEPGVKAGITVSDNSSDPLTIDAVLAVDEKPSTKIDFTRNESNNSYHAELTLNEITGYTIDVMAADSMKNEARRIVSFKIKEAEPPPDFPDAGYRISDLGRAYLAAYKEELQRKLAMMKADQAVSHHEETCSQCEPGGLVRTSWGGIEVKERKMCPTCNSLVAASEAESRKYSAAAEKRRDAETAWSDYLEGLEEGHDDLQNEINEVVNKWNREYTDLIHDWPQDPEGEKKAREKLQNLPFGKYNKLMSQRELEGLDKALLQIGCKYAELTKGLLHPAYRHQPLHGRWGPHLPPDGRWGKKREIEQKIKQGEMTLADAIPQLMKIEEMYVRALELEALRKADEKEYYRKVKQVVDEIMAATGEGE